MLTGVFFIRRGVLIYRALVTVMVISTLQTRASEQIVEIGKDDKVYKPGNGLAYLYTSPDDGSPGDLPKDSLWHRRFGISSRYAGGNADGATVWFRFKAVNKADQQVFLEIRNPLIREVEVLLMDDQGEVVQEMRAGEHIPISRRLVPHEYYYLPLDLPEDAVRQVFVKCTGKSPELYVPMNIGTLQAFYQRDQTANLLQGIFQGLIVFIFIYNLFLFLTINKNEYLYFALLVACIGFLFLIINGYDFAFFSSRWSWIHRYAGMIAAVSGIFMILFSSYFLKSRFTTPRRHIWLLSLAGVYLLALAFNVLGKTFIALRFTEFNTAATLVFLTLVAHTAWRRGQKPAIYYLVGILLFCSGFVLHMLRQFDVLPPVWHEYPVLQVSATVLVLVLSLALGKKIDEYIDKRDEARALALKTSMQNERLITHQNQILETKVLERTKDLEQTVNTLQKQREALSEANEFKDKVFSVISHDLKSPLSTLGGFLNVLKVNHLPEKEREKILDRVQLALQNTRNLLDNILVWATQKDKTDAEARQYNLHAVVEEIFELFRLQAEAKTIDMVNSTPESFSIEGNRNSMQLVLRNLISNAIKFTEHRGKVWVETREATEGVRIVVKDNGIGIQSDNKDKLFSDQHHISTRGTDNEKGTGIGLRLCREYIEKQGGRISVESREGVGTEFSIFLPNALQTIGQ